MPDPSPLAIRLARLGQEHVLTFLPSLDATARDKLLNQIGTLDLDEIPNLVATYVKSKAATGQIGCLAPAPFYPNDSASAMKPWDREKYRAHGEALLRAGKVGAFVVAGGQGTRLGYDGPKGCFPAGAVTRKPLFEVFADGVLSASRRFGRPVPWYIMTGPLNHAATVSFFETHAYFGLDPSNVMFFMQGVMPSFDAASGRMLLAAKDEIATNPDGHGGAVRALDKSGALDDMHRRGIEHLSYFQVDNATVKPIDPTFIGLHAIAPDSSGEMSSKMIPKAFAGEKLGVFCLVDGRLQVIEYSDLPPELTTATNADGSLMYSAGSIAIHVISTAFLARLAREKSFELPFHRAEKKVPYVDLVSGSLVEPTSPNGVKLEKFIFDALSLCRQSIVLETDRAEEFAPIKNATGLDSPATCAALQTARAARWLDAAGVKVPRKADGTPDCTLEVSALTAMNASELRERGIGTMIREVPRGAMLAI